MSITNVRRIKLKIQRFNKHALFKSSKNKKKKSIDKILNYRNLKKKLKDKKNQVNMLNQSYES